MHIFEQHYGTTSYHNREEREREEHTKRLEVKFHQVSMTSEVNRTTKLWIEWTDRRKGRLTFTQPRREICYDVRVVFEEHLSGCRVGTLINQDVIFILTASESDISRGRQNVSL